MTPPDLAAIAAHFLPPLSAPRNTRPRPLRLSSIQRGVILPSFRSAPLGLPQTGRCASQAVLKSAQLEGHPWGHGGAWNPWLAVAVHSELHGPGCS